MKPAPFGYCAPATVEEAVAVLAEHGDEAKVLAGGQSLVPMLALRLARPGYLVDVNRIAGLAGAHREHGVLVLGALTRHAALERDREVASAVPLLARAAPLIGHTAIRTRGTVGGSVAHGDAAAELPAVALALDAEFEVQGPAGRRQVRASEFFHGPFTTALAADELLVAVRFPVWAAGSGFAIQEVGRRHGDFAIAGVVCAVQVQQGRIIRLALALIGMGSAPLRAAAAEKSLLGADVAHLDAAEAGALAVAELDPPADVHASSRYRVRVGATLVARALTAAVEEAGHG